MTQREMNVNNFLKFYCKFEIGFQINLGVLLAVEHFQMCPPINQNLHVYYLNAGQTDLITPDSSNCRYITLEYGTFITDCVLYFSWPCRSLNKNFQGILIIFLQKTFHHQLVLLNVMFAEKD